ncbi:hypothetical protein GQ55_4G149400 [Panicum hallii var. hallii]|uniref:Uncharacterized protein n=1 Tax=Panicum hallii var. hallii TaxID=1504633 RepID=A0A2T7DYC1_9POAL|nr:hypothetical protein GQ55_4G149400 [Panicum hallii var. hallii]
MDYDELANINLCHSTRTGRGGGKTEKVTGLRACPDSTVRGFEQSRPVIEGAERAVGNEKGVRGLRPGRVCRPMRRRHVGRKRVRGANVPESQACLD